MIMRRALGLAMAAGLAAGCGGSKDVVTTSIALEVGGPANGETIDQLVGEIVDGLVLPNGFVEVLIVDGPNADVFTRMEIPHTVAGSLETEAKNTTARREVIDELDLEAEIEDTIIDIFENAPNFDGGRDLIGAIGRAQASDPDRLVVVFSSGGVHRTGGEGGVDFLEQIPAPDEFDFGDAEVEIWGVGNVPVPLGETPSRSFTQELIGYWTEFCSSENCEVTR